jgi:hypothetical protein
MTWLAVLAVLVGLGLVKVAYDTWKYERMHRARRRGADSFETALAQRRAVKGERIR